jgi:hypothetical protein
MTPSPLRSAPAVLPQPRARPRRMSPESCGSPGRPRWRPLRWSPLTGAGFLGFLLLLLVGCGTGTASFPGAEWDRWGSPEAGGLSSEGLIPVEERLQGMSTSAMMIVTEGRVAFEYGDLEEVSYLASVRKSILAMLYGIYWDREIIDLDLTLAQLDIDDHGELTAPERDARTRHVIASRSGIFHPASNSGDDLGSAPDRGSVVPGEYYLYSNWDFNAAGTIFEVQSGVDIFDALEMELAIPLRFQDFERERHEKGGDPDRSIHPSYHMHLSTRDMARVGYLALRQGRWGDHRIISEEWMEKMTRPTTPVHEMNPEHRREGPHGYGYMWWVWDGEAATGPFQGAYTGVGAVGQYITVLPELDMVIAHKTVPGEGRRVEHDQYFQLLDDVVEAYCGESC